MEDSNSTQILNQIFGIHQNLDDPTGAQFLAGNRNQYREIARFDTDDELGEWIGMQGRKWGIVQKGRVTIEDIIDQYACVYRRRKGYACKVQMRVRHNRRTGHKVVEVLEIEHDHTFYGYDGNSMVNTKLGDGKPFGSSFPPTPSNQQQFSDFARNQSSNCRLLSTSSSSKAQFDDHHQRGDGSVNAELYEMVKQEEYDLDSLIHSNAVGGNDHRDFDQNPAGQQDDDHLQMSPVTRQPMEMLLSNILNNAQQYNNENGVEQSNSRNGAEGVDEYDGETADQDQQQIGGEANYNGEFGMEEGSAGGMIMGQMLIGQQQEALAERVAEKMADYLNSQLDPKFASILSALNSLTKTVDELKRTVNIQQQQQQQQQKQQNQQPQRRFVPVSSPTTSSTMKININNNNNLTSPSSSYNIPNTANSSKISFKPFPIPQVRAVHHQQQQFQPPPKLSRADLPMLKPATQLFMQQHPNLGNRLISSGDSIKKAPFCAKSTSSLQMLPLSMNGGVASNKQKSVCPPSSSAVPSNAIHWASTKPSPNSTAISPSKSALLKFSAVVGSAALSPRKSTRKSLYAYRQRRRELSYRHMKEIGLTLILDGAPKSIFHCRPNDIALAVQTKRKELANAGKKVFYRGREVTDKLYRVDCCRTLVNGRRCGQMIADSLWPRGFFRKRMLMPILRGVSHRTKRRVDGTMRAAVADDQFEVFKEALIRLGGFLIDEQDWYKWMETAREGVNQRGLDELANSKRAHFDFEGGPLFAEEAECEDGNTATSAGGRHQRPSVTVFTSSVTALPESLLLRKKHCQDNNGVVEVEDDDVVEEENNEEDEEMMMMNGMEGMVEEYDVEEDEDEEGMVMMTEEDEEGGRREGGGHEEEVID